MRPTTPGIVLLVLVVAALAAPAAASGQTQRGPAALWDAYPLAPATTTPAPATPAPPAAETPVPAEPPAAAPEPSGDDGVPIWAIIVGAFAVIVVGGGVAIFTVARMRDRRGASDRRTAPRRAGAGPRSRSRCGLRSRRWRRRPAPARAADPHRAQPCPIPFPFPPPQPRPRRSRPPRRLRHPSRLPPWRRRRRTTISSWPSWLPNTSGPWPPEAAARSFDLAARRFLRVGRARELLGRARARGILTGAGRGRPGGALTEKGRRLLEAGSGSVETPDWQEDVVPPARGAPEAAPAGPPRLRLAGERGKPRCARPPRGGRGGARRGGRRGARVHRPRGRSAQALVRPLRRRGAGRRPRGARRR